MFKHEMHGCAVDIETLVDHLQRLVTTVELGKYMSIDSSTDVQQ